MAYHIHVLCLQLLALLLVANQSFAWGPNRHARLKTPQYSKFGFGYQGSHRHRDYLRTGSKKIYDGIQELMCISRQILDHLTGEQSDMIEPVPAIEDSAQYMYEPDFPPDWPSTPPMVDDYPTSMDQHMRIKKFWQRLLKPYFPTRGYYVPGMRQQFLGSPYRQSGDGSIVPFDPEEELPSEDMVPIILDVPSPN